VCKYDINFNLKTSKMENMSHTLNTTNGNIFDGVYEMRTSKVIGIIISMINIIIISPAMYYIIWYEKYEINGIRSLINQFASSGCWVTFVFNILIQTTEVMMSFGTANNKYFCFIHLMIKNTLAVQYSSLASSMSIMKYLYIFVLKNPSGQYDDFWCFYINMNKALLITISQFIYQFLPGRNPYHYYLCCGEDPTHLGKTKINYTLYISILSLLFIYLYVLLKKQFYISKEAFPTLSNTIGNQNQPLPSSIGNIVKTMLATYATLATSVMAVLPLVFVSLILNSTPPNKLSTFPYYDLVQFHSHVCPFIITSFLTLSYYTSNKKLRTAALRKLKEIFLNEAEKMSNPVCF
jgi:hypothetical protein